LWPIIKDMTALFLIGLAVAVAALAPKHGAEDRPGFDERHPLA
jgi:hypothetical protein